MIKRFPILVLFLCALPLAAQIANVQCGDATAGVWQNPCPVPGTDGGVNPTVTAGGIDTSQPSTGAYLDFKWTTPNCSSSVVIYDPDINYAALRRWVGAGGTDGCNPGYAKNHTVHANYLQPSYAGLTTSTGTSITPYSLWPHFFELASQDQSSGTWTSLPGPNRGTGYAWPFGVVSPVPTNLTGQSSAWGAWLVAGADSVYQGHDLRVVLNDILAQGPVATSVVMPYSSVQITRQTMSDGHRLHRELPRPAGRNALQYRCCPGEQPAVH